MDVNILQCTMCNIFCFFIQLSILLINIISVGHTANYAIVVAQLNTQSVCRGVHTFIVQLRDEETHEPLPGIKCYSKKQQKSQNRRIVTGIKLGNIGSLMGSNAVNNGFLGFDNVRIPRDRMLMKNSQVKFSNKKKN